MKKFQITKFKIGDVVTNKKGWRREINEIQKDYLGDKGRTGYKYRDLDFPMIGYCSQEHLIQWSKQ